MVPDRIQEATKTPIKRKIRIGMIPGVIPLTIPSWISSHVENDEQYEITTFRTESTYQDYRRPDHVEFVRSLEGTEC